MSVGEGGLVFAGWVALHDILAFGYKLSILYIIRYNWGMSINGDCIHCGGHSTDAEWDAWHGECQWCGEFDVEWEERGDVGDEDYDEGEGFEDNSWFEEEQGGSSTSW